MTDDWLAGAVTSAAYGWRLERRDGVTMGFTSHDQDILFDGLLYLASPGMVPSAITESSGLESNGLEISGAITNAAIREDDMSSGRWDGAHLTVFLFDWSQADNGQRILAEGELGEISYSRAGFQVDVKGIAAVLDAPVVPQTSPGCRAQFCDHDCGLNYRRFTHAVTVHSYDNRQIIFAQDLPEINNAFGYGEVRFMDGVNSGLILPVIRSGSNNIYLADEPASIPVAGDRAELLQGCDKVIATCANRFGNAVNFRGEPFLPGNDLLTRYPGGS